MTIRDIPKSEINLEAVFAEADDVIAGSQRLTDQVLATAKEGVATKAFQKRKAFAPS